MSSRTETAAPVFKPSGLLIDLDGTLIDSGDRFSPAVASAVKRAAKRIPVAIASGREPDEVSHFARSLGLDGPQVCDNGASLVDPLTGRSFDHCPMPEAVSRRLIDSICAEGLTFYAVDNGRMVKNKERFREWKVTIIAANSGDETTARSVLDKLASDETTSELSTNPEPRGLMAVGDGLNDVSMFELVGIPVAMGNASEEVKRHARFIVGNQADDGLAEAIERYVL